MRYLAMFVFGSILGFSGLGPDTWQFYTLACLFIANEYF